MAENTRYCGRPEAHRPHSWSGMDLMGWECQGIRETEPAECPAGPSCDHGCAPDTCYRQDQANAEVLRRQERRQPRESDVTAAQAEGVLAFAAGYFKVMHTGTDDYATPDDLRGCARRYVEFQNDGSFDS